MPPAIERAAPSDSTRSDGQRGRRGWPAPRNAARRVERCPIRHIFWIAVVPGAVATALVALVREPRPVLPPKASVPNDLGAQASAKGLLAEGDL